MPNFDGSGKQQQAVILKFYSAISDTVAVSLAGRGLVGHKARSHGRTTAIHASIANIIAYKTPSQAEHATPATSENRRQLRSYCEHRIMLCVAPEHVGPQ